MFFLDIDGFGISLDPLKSKIYVKVIIIPNLDMNQLFWLLKEDRCLQFLCQVLTIHQEVHLRMHVHYFIRIHVNRMEDLFLHRQHVEMA